ncbi:MAG: discoidin domain-containing protein [Marinilabiliaceae bacterium]|nr:discoidin domain-containing protein [Marinilabiliaceae bacterium]
MKFFNKRLYLTALIVLCCTLIGIAQTNYYVSPSGSNKADGTKNHPWKTLDYAKKKARQVDEMVMIHLQDGEYVLSEPLILNAEDSNLSIQAAEDATPVISGGANISGWRPSGKKGVWTAKVPSGVVGRHLYIDGQRAVRARTKDGEGWVRIANRPSVCNSVSCRDDVNTPNGFKVSEDFLKLSNVGDVEMVNTMRWKMYRGKLDRIEDSIAYVDQRYWDLAKIGPFAICENSNDKAVAWLENAIEFLDEEGEWYLDKRKRTIYYKPVKGEDLKTAKVVLSNVEKLIDADGVCNLNIEGITFKYANWNQASKPQGYVSIQSGAILTDPDYQSIEDGFEGLIDIPGNVHFKNTRNVVVKGNTFKNLGGTALNFDTNNQNINIFANTFEGISGGAITIGNLQDHHIVSSQLSRDIIIDNNIIRDVGLEYYDACAIKCSFVKDACIVNNTIDGSSAGGVSLGWGWGRYDVDNFAFWKDGSDKAYNHPTIAGGVIVAHNSINNVTKKLGDAAAIYNLGASPGSKWYANFIEGVLYPEAPNCAHYGHGIYPDNGSRGIEIKDNVVIGTSHKPYLANGSHDYVVRGEAYYFEHEAGEYPAWIKEKAGVKEGINTIRKREEIEKLMPPALSVNSNFYIQEKGAVVGKAITAVGSAANSKASFATDGRTETYWQGAGKTGELILDMGKVSDVYYVNSAFGYIDAKTMREVYFKHGYDFEYFISVDGKNWKTFGEGRKISTLAINQQYMAEYKPVEARYVKLKIYSSGDDVLGVLRFKVVDLEPVYGRRVFGPQ